MTTTKPSQFLSWLRLLRIPNLPSAISNILMAYLLVHQTWTPIAPLVLLIVASAAMYCAGMILNDVFDYEVDLVQRPQRPLTSGAISKSLATSVGFSLLIAGVILASSCGFFAGTILDPAPSAWRTGAFAALLAICILLYDGPLKRTIAAPFLMGGCRTLNILMGASTFVSLAAVDTAASGTGAAMEFMPRFMPGNELLGMPLLVWWVAIAIGGLITGATLLGRNEAAEEQPRGPMIAAGLIVLISLIGLALSPYCLTSTSQGAFQVSETQKTIFPMFIGFMSLTILRRVFVAVTTLKPKAVQIGVVSVLRSLIILDAAICYLAVPHQTFYALAVLSLMVPTFLLGRYFAST